uniref:Peptidase S8/S53 domain-containing protein n=1 Tax=Ananas comosus var. bracteatus TaxID=296719 RepID=A0A6V7NJW9_ANACO|nr:unnamed protein product [Ananas comosus var. bracteatus]
MATPDVGGIAALIKSVYPGWSPAAVKSAIITTSDVKDKQGLPIVNELQTPANVYELGAGHVNPSKAVDPGLVYDTGADDYVRFICTIYGDHGASIIVHSRNVSCADEKQIATEELNLPSIVFPIGLSPEPNVTRTVTNVGKLVAVDLRSSVGGSGVGEGDGHAVDIEFQQGEREEDVPGERGNCRGFRRLGLWAPEVGFG